MTTWERIERKREDLVRFYYSKIQNALARSVQPVVKNLTNDFQQVLHSVDHLVTDKEIKEEFVDLYIQTGLDFKKDIEVYTKNFKGYRTKDLVDQVFAEWMGAFSVSETLPRIVSITATTREQVKRIIRVIIDKGLSDGLTIGDITAQLEKQIPIELRIQNKFRASRIARTEVLTASNRASLKAIEDTGYNATKTWVTAPFGMAKTERHNLAPELADGPQTVPKNMPFVIYGESLDYPGFPGGSAENVINCQCVQTFEII